MASADTDSEATVRLPGNRFARKIHSVKCYNVLGFGGHGFGGHGGFLDHGGDVILGFFRHDDFELCHSRPQGSAATAASAASATGTATAATGDTGSSPPTTGRGTCTT